MLWLVLVPWTASAMSLDEAVDAALARSPITDVSAARLAEAEARVHEANAHLLPTVSAMGALVAQNEVTINFADNLPEIPLLDPSQFEDLLVQPGLQLQAGAQVSQPIVAPPVWAARGAARQGVALAEEEAVADQSRVISSTVTVWHASAEAHSLLDDALRAEELAGRLVEKSEAMVEHGVAAPDQILPLQRAHASARARVATAEAAVSSTDGVLQLLTGLPGRADPSTVPGALPDLDALLAALDRPDLDVAQARIEAADSLVAVEKSTRWPLVAATAGVTVLSPEPDLGEPVNWRIGLGVTVPVFQGGKVTARVDQASARVAMAQAGERALREGAEIEIRMAHGSLARAMAALDEHDEAVRLSQQAVDAAEARLTGGGGTLLSLQQAQLEQVAAEAQRTHARAEAARAADVLALAVRGTL